MCPPCHDSYLLSLWSGRRERESWSYSYVQEAICRLCDIANSTTDRHKWYRIFPHYYTHSPHPRHSLPPPPPSPPISPPLFRMASLLNQSDFHFQIHIVLPQRENTLKPTRIICDISCPPLSPLPPRSLSSRSIFIFIGRSYVGLSFLISGYLKGNEDAPFTALSILISILESLTQWKCFLHV